MARIELIASNKQIVIKQESFRIELFLVHVGAHIRGDQFELIFAETNYKLVSTRFKIGIS